MTTKDITTPESGAFKEAEAARLLGMSPRQLRAVRAAGQIEYFDISAGSGQRKHVRYTAGHLEAFIASRSRRVATPAPAPADAAPRRPRRHPVTALGQSGATETALARSIARGEVSEWGR